MGLPISDLNQATRHKRSIVNNGSVELAAGAPVQVDYQNENGLYGVQLNSSVAPCGLMGVLLKALPTTGYNQSNAAGVFEGPVPCRFKNHASAVAKTFARPVPGQQYFTYSAIPTPFLLLTDQSSGTDVHTPEEGAAGTAPMICVLPVLRGSLEHLIWSGPGVADADGILAAQATSSTAPTVVKTFLAQPDVARQISVLPGGVTTDVPGGDVVVAGTDIHGNAQTENLTFLANATDAKNTTKAFRTVTTITFPTQDGTGATYDVGWTGALGLPFALPVNTVLKAALGGTIEGTAPTVVAAATAQASLITLNSALNSTQVDVWLLRG